MKNLFIILIMTVSTSAFASSVKQITERVTLFSGNSVMMVWYLENKIAKRVIEEWRQTSQSI